MDGGGGGDEGMQPAQADFIGETMEVGGGGGGDRMHAESQENARGY